MQFFLALGEFVAAKRPFLKQAQALTWEIIYGVSFLLKEKQNKKSQSTQRVCANVQHQNALHFFLQQKHTIIYKYRGKLRPTATSPTFQIDGICKPL